MAMKKFNLFSNDNNSNIEDKQEKDIINKELIGYILNEFPEVANDIKVSLGTLGNTLEKAIDYIEDKSSVIVKEARDFELSNKYRQASIELHEISNNINEYINWMEQDKKEDTPKEENNNEPYTEEIKAEDCIQVVEDNE